MLANGVQMKQIQEWSGHSNFSTTADVYSHLDFSSKVQSANVISKALNVESEQKKVVSVPQDIDMEMLLRVISEMKALGIENLDDYFEYANEHLGMEMLFESKPKKDFSM